MGPADLHLFTDGAADGGTERGGRGVVVFGGGGGEVARLSLPAGRYCSSFTAEAAALLAAVRWLGTAAPQAQGGLCWWPEGGGRRAHEGGEDHAGEVQDRAPPGAEKVAGNGG